MYEQFQGKESYILENNKFLKWKALNKNISHPNKGAFCIDHLFSTNHLCESDFCLDYGFPAMDIETMPPTTTEL